MENVLRMNWMRTPDGWRGEMKEIEREKKRDRILDGAYPPLSTLLPLFICGATMVSPLTSARSG